MSPLPSFCSKLLYNLSRYEMKYSWRKRSRIRNECENCPVSSQLTAEGTYCSLGKSIAYIKAFPTFGVHISTTTYLSEDFYLVVNMLKTDTNTHLLTVPKEYMGINVKCSELVEKCIYVSPNRSTVSKV